MPRNNNDPYTKIDVSIVIDHNAMSQLPTNKAFANALNYLIFWGNSDRVELYIDRDMNINASHQITTSKDVIPQTYKQYYLIGGIYDAISKTYSFHS